MQTERASSLEHTVRDLGQVRVVVRHQMETEHVLAGVHVDAVVLENKVVACIKLLAPSNVDHSKAQIRDNDLP